MTAVAAVITAVTGLVLGLNQIGVFDSSDSSAQVSADRNRAPAPSGPAESGNRSATESASHAYQANLPLKEKMRSGVVTYEILGYEVRPDSDGKLALSLSIRATYDGRYSFNFWDDSFRLAVGEDTYAPSSGLNELVASESSKVGTVLFVVPDTTRTAELKIRFEEGPRTVPFELQPVPP